MQQITAMGQKTAPREPLRIAVIGLGDFAVAFFHALLMSDSCFEVTALADTSAEARQWAAGEFPQTFVAPSLDDVPRNSDTTAIWLLTPAHGHLDETLACLAAGRHV